MPRLPVQYQLFQAFLGTHEGIHSIPLPAVYSPDGSVNVWMDKFGRVGQIPGYTALNSAVTTDTGASATAVRAIIPYRQGDFTRRLVGVFDDETNEYELYISNDTGATWNFNKEWGTAAAAGAIPDHSQFGDDLFIVNGVNTPQIYDGSTISNIGETQSPTPTAAAGSAGLLAGTYKWKLVSVEADGLRHGGSAASTEVQLTDEEADLTWTADTDSNVVGYELYRTTGSGVVFYLAAYIDGRLTASYTDSISDLELLEGRALQEHGDAPPNGTHFVEAHKQRMWWGRTDTNPQRAYFSDPGNPDSVGPDNFLEFVDATSIGDVLTGMEGNFEGLMVIFQERSIWTVGGSGQIIGNIQDWNVERSNAQMGAVHIRAVTRVPAGAKYVDQNGEEQTTNVVTLAYWSPLGDIRLFDGENDLIVSYPMKDTLASYKYANRTNVHCYDDAKNGQIVWFYPSSSSSGPCDSAVCWNYRWGVWYEWTPMSMASSAVIETATSAQTILTGEADTATGGLVYDFFDAADFTFNGTDITASWMSKTIYGQTDRGLEMVTKKRWRELDLVFADQDSVTVTVEWYQSYQTDAATPIGSTTVSTEALPNRTSQQNHIVLVADSGATAGDYQENPGLRVRLTATGSAGPWKLEGMMVGYQVLDGARRRIRV